MPVARVAIGLNSGAPGDKVDALGNYNFRLGILAQQ
jgi:hypothetical protein